MEETIIQDSPWFASVIVSALTVFGTIFTAWLGKKRLEEEIARLNAQLQNIKSEHEAAKKEAEQIKTAYLEIVQKLKTLRDFEIGVDGKDIAKILNKGL